ncbi:poly [ADP-ribose] polymerase [Prorops nasuta]|uniref:poly [ADP-ribose] polymerase n=1 Tax=Prorops nasuta TaxID=863751 RepID=UPI0034CD1779
MNDDLPYIVEYAKSGRSQCKDCAAPIMKDVLRLGTVTQSPFYDGKIQRWYHQKCFFQKQRPQSVADIAHFDSIRWEDQEHIKLKIAETSGLPLPGRGKKRGAKSSISNNFKLEYAKSSQSTCKGCLQKIIKSEVRISKKDFDSDEGRKYGGIDRWHHVLCFEKLRKELQFFEAGESLPGFKTLSKEDQQNVKQILPKIENDAPAAKQMKIEKEDEEEVKLLKKQNEQVFKKRDGLSILAKSALVNILEINNQHIPEGMSAILDHLADIICFGALEICPKCGGQLSFTSGVGYTCNGNLSEWVKCENVIIDPKRSKVQIPIELKETYPQLFKKLKVGKRAIRLAVPSTSSVGKKEDVVDGPKVQGRPMPLQGMNFVVIGKTAKPLNDIKREILLLGGKVTTKIDSEVVAVISTPKDVEKLNKKMQEAKDLGIQAVSEDFLEEVKEFTNVTASLINKLTISPWGNDPSPRITSCQTKSAAKSTYKSKYENIGSGKVKLQIKDGGMVDPDSGLQDCAHIYKEGKEKYAAVLGLTDIQTKRNSYYKIQILEHDKRSSYWVFRSWGRIGTTIGNNKLEDMDLDEAKETFERLYEEKTGNCWTARHHFVKVPNKMYPLEMDEGGGDSASGLLESSIKSNLKQQVQDLIRLIFDEQKMKEALLEFEIDIDKMPLGKLSKNQIEKAYKVLSSLQDLLQTGKATRELLIDASNRFYTYIPHNFGISGPKILEDLAELKQKCEMLDSLLEMEIAYSLLHGKLSSDDEKKNPLDVHYEQLKTEIDVLDKNSDEFKLIETYVRNTHASTHSTYELVIEDVFCVTRQGEERRYKPFKKLNNRQLLWHGSRVTNYAGILSQGLRIAPPEAPVTGYMFGKGIYFADMVSKSANYCCTNTQNPTGLIMLCEVALGNIYERYEADYIEKLPKGKHSTKGCGQTQPDPEKTKVLPDGVTVPCGPPVPVNLKKKSALLYNEYIVYDVAQVKTKYLLKVNFKYKV